MGRRYISLVALALTVGFGVRMALAQAEAPPSQPAVEALPPPAEMLPPSEPPPAKELPPPATRTGDAAAAKIKKALGLKPKGAPAQPTPEAARSGSGTARGA